MAANECVPAGSGPEGARCAAASDCAGGLACVADAGSSPQATYFTLLQAYIDRGGGTCKLLCDRTVPASAAGCASNQVCEPILPSRTGIVRPDYGICD